MDFGLKTHNAMDFKLQILVEKFIFMKLYELKTLQYNN